jgi:dihydrofolate reductase
MGRLLYSINVTLDGCVDHRSALADEALHRHAMDGLARADALIFGRVTYQMMEEAWRPPASDAMPAWTQPFARVMDAARKYVVSSMLESVDWHSELVRGDLGEAVRAIKDDVDELRTGGVRLPTALAELGLIDEYELVVHPRVYGQGPRLLDGLTTPLDLELVGSEDVGSGVVAKRYVPRR